MRQYRAHPGGDTVAKTAAPHDADAKPWKRYLLIGGPLVVVIAVLVFVFWPEIKVRGWINRLSKPEVRVEQIEALESYDDRDLVNRLLLEAVEDDDRDFGARRTCAGLLIKRDRLAKLEGLLKTGSLMTRGVILRALSGQRFFRTTYAEDPVYRAHDTVREWLGRDGDLTRSHAIQLAMEMGMDDVMPLIRPVLTAPPAPNVHPRVQRELLQAAVGAVEKFADCESVERVAELAATHGDPLVRLRCLQILDRTVVRLQPPADCRDAMPEAQQKALVLGALEDADKAVRMKAMLILGRRPAWAADVSERLESILDSAAPPEERRQALEALGSLGQPAFMERFPGFFHDPSAEVRSSAVRVAGTVSDVPLVGCLIGLIEDETESDLLFETVASGLRAAAGKWVGLPAPLQKRATRDRLGFKRDLSTLFSRGEIEGLTRAGWAEAWFRWWCGHLELTPEQTERAVTARGAFRAAKDARDRDGARAALDGLGFDVPGLFAYERAWIQLRENR
jgi:hypothetical protein